MRQSYDKATDTLYIFLREAPAADSREIEPDVVLDVGSDGRPVAYEVQFASTKHALVGRLILEAMAREEPEPEPA